MRRAILALTALTVAACADTPTQPILPEAPDAALADDAVDDTWIVVFDGGVADAPGLARRLTAAYGGQLRYSYQYALKGFAATLSAAAVSALRNNPNVAYVEADGPVWAVGTQDNPPWGLDRIDQRDLPLSSSYTYGTDGTGVTAYIVDTGIRTTHNDFGGRASSGFDAVDGGTADDCHGHGTHVAGTVGGTTYGVAKDVGLVAVRVLNCSGSGTWAGVIAGIDWVTNNHVSPAVANMSLGGGASSAVDDAVRNSIAAGVVYALAAGNGNFVGRPQDACSSSPARTVEAITVGATTSNDSEASFSNYGPCVDILAPGVGVTSAWYTSNSATNTISGTSMATPHVAGAAALFLEANPGASPSTVEAALESSASVDKIALHRASRNGGTPNLLLFVGDAGSGGGGGSGEVDDPPSVSISSPTGGTVSGEITVVADASDDGGGVTQVEFFVDGVSIGTDTNASGGWSVPWNTTTASNGSHSLTAVATDTKPQTTTSAAVTVTVDNASGGGGGDLTLSTSAHANRKWLMVDLLWSGAGGGSVDVYRDGALVATVANTGSYTDKWENDGAPSATHKVCEAGTSTCSSDVTTNF
ncbi:MAG TPA: S8 family serine peptidase [Longimicrobiales bacterium]|nr:S8 family serine peptidase [Longimicrobiales bacterium]